MNGLTLPFTKMHGLGNDFVMLPQAPSDNPADCAQWAKRLCDRHFGIGADGLIFPQAPDNADAADVKFVYYNSDGSVAEMCGNGIRCFARYLAQKAPLSPDTMLSARATTALLNHHPLRVETGAGLLAITLNADHTVTVNMGCPIVDPALVPFIGTSTTLNVFNTAVTVHPISMGNPHAIIFYARPRHPPNTRHLWPCH
jgi:diaminopimelate epimerase